tara:strand:+ start:1540 stop:1815 length:276 start_codon:yes stop_codon:yes gene_type:complete
MSANDEKMQKVFLDMATKSKAIENLLVDYNSDNKEIIDEAKSNRKRKIVSTMILVEWNDSPKMETLFHEMPSDLQQSFDDWISDIEEEVQS